MDLHSEVCTRSPMLSIILWEIEGFQLTVGDGCRKLGGHGREMILLRNGDSHLVNDEFEDELQGCKKPMSRDLAGLMTHENSGVEGHSATADVDENSDVAGELPRCEVVESQKSAQVPAAPLYCACIVGRGREDPTVTVTMAVVSLDGCSLNTIGEGNILTIVLSDNNTTCNPGFMASILTECVTAHGAMS